MRGFIKTILTAIVLSYFIYIGVGGYKLLTKDISKTYITEGMVEKLQLRERTVTSSGSTVLVGTVTVSIPPEDIGKVTDYYVVVNEISIQVPYEIWKTTYQGEKVSIVYDNYNKAVIFNHLE